MARPVSEIKNEITTAFVSSPTIVKFYNLDQSKSFDDQFSSVSLESRLFFIVAYAINVLERLFDVHKNEVNDIISNNKAHTLRWYATKAKQFLYGQPLPIDSDIYDTSNMADDEINAALIITNAAVVEVDIEQQTILRIKVSKTVNDELTPLTEGEKSSFENYMSKIKDAGVKLQITSTEADHLFLTVDAYVDPLVFTSDGKIDGTEPVRETINNYLKNLPFNGTFVLAYLMDELQKISGMVIPNLKNASASFGEVVTPFDVKYQPDAGYLKFYDDAALVINYILQPEIQ